MAHRGDLDRESEQLLLHVVRAVADATHASDPYMAGHSSRVAAYCERIAESLGLPARERLVLFVAAAFHDVGYLSTPEYILRKPSVLAEDEMEEVRVHPVRGAEVFGAEPALAEIARAVRHHHERFDGSGYPEGLAGEEIPSTARILAIADTLEAMTVARPYRAALTYDDVVEEVSRRNAAKFDPVLVRAFLAVPKAEWESIRAAVDARMAKEPLRERVEPGRVEPGRELQSRGEGAR